MLRLFGFEQTDPADRQGLRSRGQGAGIGSFERSSPSHSLGRSQVGPSGTMGRARFPTSTGMATARTAASFASRSLRRLTVRSGPSGTISTS